MRTRIDPSALRAALGWLPPDATMVITMRLCVSILDRLNNELMHTWPLMYGQ